MFQQGTGKSYTVICKCGQRVAEQVESETMAQVLADRHETTNIRRAYRHDTNILVEVR